MREQNRFFSGLSSPLKGKLPWVPGCIGVAFIAAAWALHFSRAAQGLWSLQSGVATCFWRVGQSYTSLVSGQAGNRYLARDFTAATEECFADANALAEGLSGMILAGPDKKLVARLNTLASDAHWFHAKIKEGGGRAPALLGEPEGDAQSERAAGIGKRFTKLEALYNQVQAELGRASSTRSSVSAWASMVLFAFLGAAGVLAWANYTARRREDQELNEAEARAQEALLKGQVEDFNLVRDIALAALASRGPLRSAQLLTQFNWRSFALLAAGQRSEDPESIKQAAKLSLEEIWSSREAAAPPGPKAQRDVVPVPAPTSQVDFGSGERSSGKDNKVFLEAPFSRALDMHAGRLFSLGVNLGLDIDEKAWVPAAEGANEALDHVVFNLMGLCLDKLANNQKARKLSVKIASTGKGASITFSHALEGQSPAGEGEMGALREILTPLGAQIYQEQNLQGGQDVRIVFTGEAPKSDTATRRGRLTTIRKGSKRSLRQELSPS